MEVERCAEVKKVVCEVVAKPRTVEKRVERCGCRKVCKNVIKEKKCGLGQALVPKTGPTVTTKTGPTVTTKTGPIVTTKTGPAVITKTGSTVTTTEKTLPRTRTWTEHGPWKKVTNTKTGFNNPKLSTPQSGFGRATESKRPKWNIFDGIRTFFHETLPNKFKRS